MELVESVHQIGVFGDEVVVLEDGVVEGVRAQASGSENERKI